MKKRMLTGMMMGMMSLGFGMGCSGVAGQAGGAFDSAEKADSADPAAGSDRMSISSGCSHHSDQIEVTRESGKIIVNTYTYAHGEKLTFDLAAAQITSEVRDTSGAVKSSVIGKADAAAFQAAIKKAKDGLALIAKGNGCTKANIAALEQIAYIEALTANVMRISSQCSHHSEQIMILDGETTLTFEFTSASPIMTKLIMNKLEANGIFDIRRGGSGAYTKKLVTGQDKVSYVGLLDRAFAAANLVLQGNACTNPNPAAEDVLVYLPTQLLRPSSNRVSGDASDDIVHGPFAVTAGGVVLAELVPSGGLTVRFYEADKLLKAVECVGGPLTNPTCNAIVPHGATKVDFSLTYLESFGYELIYDLDN